MRVPLRRGRSFGAQEPGNEATIRSFCRANYGVDFPMTAKQTVIGGTAHPFYRWIVEQAGEGAAPKWNFHKILVGKNGEAIQAFGRRWLTRAPVRAAILPRAGPRPALGGSLG